jgi:hypothetical protein
MSKKWMCFSYFVCEGINAICSYEYCKNKNIILEYVI